MKDFLTVLLWLAGFSLALLLYVNFSTGVEPPTYRNYHIDPVSGSCYVKDIHGTEGPCDYDTLKRALQHKNID
jgi:hypothetical protein